MFFSDQQPRKLQRLIARLSVRRRAAGAFFRRIDAEYEKARISILWESRLLIGQRMCLQFEHFYDTMQNIIRKSALLARDSAAYGKPLLFIPEKSRQIRIF